MLAFFMLCCGASKAPLQALESHVTIMRVTDDGQQIIIGSGVEVDVHQLGPNIKAAVMTAKHVIDGENRVDVCGIRNELGCTRVLAHSDLAEHDLSVLLLDQAVAEPAKVKETGFYLTQQVTVIGVPEGDLTLFEGQVIQNQIGIIEGTIYDQWGISGGWCNYGSSGGGVFNKKGQLIGLVHAMPLFPVSEDVDVPSNSLCLAMAL